MLNIKLAPLAVIEAAFRFEAFINANAQWTELLSPTTVSVIKHITSINLRPTSLRPASGTVGKGPSTRARSRSLSTEPKPYIWPQEWSVDKTRLRNDIRRFEALTTAIKDHLQLGPTTSTTAATSNPSGSDPTTRDTSTKDMANDEQNYRGTGFSRLQWHALQGLIQAGPAGPPGPPSPAGLDGAAGGNNPNLKPDDISFFDPSHKGEGAIVNARRHAFFKDVYAFIDRLNNMAVIHSREKVAQVLPTCFRSDALTWHTTELDEAYKGLLRTATLDS